MERLQNICYYFQDTQRAFSNSSLVVKAAVVKGKENPRNIITIYTNQIFSKWKPESRQGDGRYRYTEKIVVNYDQKVVTEKKIGETSRETVPGSYTNFYGIGNLPRKVKIASSRNIVPKKGKWKSITRSKNLSRRRIKDTTPVLFTNQQWEEMPTVTTEKTRLSVLTDTAIEFILMKSDYKENVRKVEDIRKKRSQTYTGK